MWCTSGIWRPSCKKRRVKAYGTPGRPVSFQETDAFPCRRIDRDGIMKPSKGPDCKKEKENFKCGPVEVWGYDREKPCRERKFYTRKQRKFAALP